MKEYYDRVNVSREPFFNIIVLDPKVEMYKTLGKAWLGNKKSVTIVKRKEK
jgi:hypothetical protein